MALTALSEVETRLDDVLPLIESARSILGDATPPRLQVEALRATLQGALEDGRALLRDMDETDPETLIPVTEAVRTVQLWVWHRETRSAILDAIRVVQQLMRVSETYLNGVRERIVVARQGETLQSIAARELGAWEEWPRLIERNPDLTPGAVVAGTTLVIPPR